MVRSRRRPNPSLSQPHAKEFVQVAVSDVSYRGSLAADLAPRASSPTRHRVRQQAHQAAPACAAPIMATATASPIDVFESENYTLSFDPPAQRPSAPPVAVMPAAPPLSVVPLPTWARSGGYNHLSPDRRYRALLFRVAMASHRKASRRDRRFC